MGDDGEEGSDSRMVAGAAVCEPVEASLLIFQGGDDDADNPATMKGDDETMSDGAAPRLLLHVRRLSGDSLAFGRFYRGLRAELEAEIRCASGSAAECLGSEKR